jgi:probable phosphomutase (TIGR03848 family)
MAIVILIRHGEHEYLKNGILAGRLPGIHLNENGRGQALKVGQLLSHFTIKAIYSSPLERAMETARSIASLSKLEVIVREPLLEMDYGEWQGQELKKLRDRSSWETIQHLPSTFSFPGGESFIDAQQRVASEINRLSKKHGKRDIIVVVSHSDMIKLAICYYLNIHLDVFQRLMISPASLTSLVIDKKNCTLLNLNVPPDLAESSLFNIG